MNILLNPRKVLALLTLSLLSISVMNCSKDSTDVSPSEIIGTWKIKNLYIKEGAAKEEDQLPLLIALIPCFKDLSFTFKSNGEMTSNTPKECKDEAEDFVGTGGTAKFILSAGKLTITDSDGSKSVQDVTFSGNQMIFISTEIDAGITTITRSVFIKQ